MSMIFDRLYVMKSPSCDPTVAEVPSEAKGAPAENKL